MVQQTVDSKVREYGMGTSETEFSTGEKQLPVAVKKTVLRDLQNDNRVRVPNSIEKSPLLKDTSPLTSTIKLSGTKRDSPECPESPSQHRSPNSNFTNGHLVYVRRKSEAEVGKSSICDSTNTNANGFQSRPLGQQKEIVQPIPQIKNPEVSCFPAHSPIAMTSSMIPSRKPSVPLPQKSGMQLASKESNDLIVSDTPSSGNLKALRNLNWEERYCQLHSLLNKLDQSQQVDYLKMLWSLSSVELNRHAVELEKRSIQLSLEEAKEFQRVQVLNVLGKPSVSPSTHQHQPEKRV
ncbi:uncharacterized protein LOC133792665 isoform X2 [Humulus lupulus]|uniref:uncharacterized protein LOC133792665 isoform X2 n=1 Tax=Humulus lupulus TaxID=3486 RepID=UPI002B411522|nr:uncharacterized protein LOC133792665 isoform X2 [Humulus lupulus]